MPEQAIDCSTPVSPSNTVTTTITNEKKYGLGTYDYDITILNNTTGQACTVSRGYTNMGPNPLYANFFAEPTHWQTGVARLPQFTAFTMSQSMFYHSGTTHSISEEYAPGNYNNWVMRNPSGPGGVVNINKSSIASGNIMMTWVSSQNT